MSDKQLITLRGGDGNIITLEVHKAVSSTVKLAREYAKSGYPDRYVVFSEKQLRSDLTGNKSADVETESGVFISCILRPSFFPSQAPLLGAMSATAMISALEEHTAKRLGVGWVSDVYCEGVKIGASSIEGKLDNFTTYEYLIVSFAIKLNKENFPPSLSDMIKKVFESDNTSIALIIAKNILGKFFNFYSNLKNSKKFMDIYNAKFILRGRTVKYNADGKKKTCKVLGIEPKNGALIVETKEAGIFNITSPSVVTAPKRIRLKKEKK